MDTFRMTNFVDIFLNIEKIIVTLALIEAFV
jgi:hypothetical protein